MLRAVGGERHHIPLPADARSPWGSPGTRSLRRGPGGRGGGERQDEDEPEGEFPVEITAAEFPAKQSLSETTNLLLSVQNTGEDSVPNLAITIFTVANEDNATEVDASAAETDAADEEDLAEEVEQQLQEELQAAAEEEDAEEVGTDTTVGTDEQERSVAEGPFSVLSDQPGWRSPRARSGSSSRASSAGGDRARARPARRDRAGERRGRGADQHIRLRPDGAGRVHRHGLEGDAGARGTYTVHYRVAAGLQGNAVAVTGDDSAPEGEFIVQITDAPPQTRVNDAGEVVPIKPGDIVGQAGSSEQQSEPDGGGTATNPSP